jgi:hypothetical protein
MAHFSYRPAIRRPTRPVSFWNEPVPARVQFGTTGPKMKRRMERLGLTCYIGSLRKF